MVKFSRELDAQLIPEWKEAFVNYRQLKKHVKRVKLAGLRSATTPSDDIPLFAGGLRTIAARFSAIPTSRNSDDAAAIEGGGEEESESDLEMVQSMEQEVKEFFEKVDEEMEKVNSFYKTKESEFCERGDMLDKQLGILSDLKKVLHDRSSSVHRHYISSPSIPSSPDHSVRSGELADTLFSSFSAESMVAGEGKLEGATTVAVDVRTSSTLANEVISVLEAHGVSFIGCPKSKAKKGAKPRAASVRIDIPATSPMRTVLMIWEELVNGLRKDGGGGSVNRRQITLAEKAIRSAYMELYKGLELLRQYSALNMVAFRKILKKFDKVSSRRASEKYMKIAKGTHFNCSDKVARLGDEVESIFTKHFAGSDRKKAMKFLKPSQPKESHMITFLVGLFTGTFVALFCVYAILARLSGIFSPTVTGYMETVYPIFSMFALLSLHIFLYGCNLWMWRSKRINQNFIFDFSPNTALNPCDAFLICTGLMTAVVGAMVLHLSLFNGSSSILSGRVDAIPGILLIISLFILLMPFNICYRPTRFTFLRILRNIACSPFYTVPLVDFFMADQLTSQVPLLRHMEFTACYFVTGGFRNHPATTCRSSHQSRLLAYVISFLPYYWRALQCGRRYMEEGYDTAHLANGGKYMSAMVAAAARFKYAVDPTPFWLAVVVISSTSATLYQLYWDFVKDWGFFKLGSKNLFLRDELVLKNNSVYYVSIVLNFVLRLVWIETVLGFRMKPFENRMVEFLLASLEIIRRGHWNFYRLENEHLNNVGHFRAVKTVPLPFHINGGISDK